MGEFVRAISVSALAPGACMEVLVAGRPLALFNVGGEFHATSNGCIHRGGPLGQGLLDGPIVMCPWHNWTFDVRTGESTANPTLRVMRYEVKVEDGSVWVNIE